MIFNKIKDSCSLYTLDSVCLFQYLHLLLPELSNLLDHLQSRCLYLFHRFPSKACAWNSNWWIAHRGSNSDNPGVYYIVKDQFITSITKSRFYTMCSAWWNHSGLLVVTRSLLTDGKLKSCQDNRWYMLSERNSSSIGAVYSYNFKSFKLVFPFQSEMW